MVTDLKRGDRIIWRFCSPYVKTDDFGPIHEGTVIKVTEGNDWAFVRPRGWLESSMWLHLPSLNMCERIK
jgi:hypothetical protein